MKHWLLLAFVCLSFHVLAQKEKVKGNLSVFVDGGYLLGGQTTTNAFVYQSGFSSRIGIKKIVSPFFSFGGGVGVDLYDFVEFYPLFINIDAQAKPEKNGVFTSFFGYSFANNSTNASLSQTTLGGGFLEVGRVWRFDINEVLRFYSGVTIKHQFSAIQAKDTFGGEDKIRTDFDGIHIRIGILIN